MQFHSKPIAEHGEVPLADEGRLESLIGRWSAPLSLKETPAQGKNSCYVVSVEPSREPSAQLSEITALVRAQGDRVVGQERHFLHRKDPRTYLGRGACEAIAQRARDAKADLVVLDAELSPSQMRNLEDLIGCSITDREGVILNVFLRNARTKRARIQVEIAQLEYLRPRIRGLGINMDQQAGGMAKARGPGETISELLARRLDGRLADLRAAEAKLKKAQATQRQRRSDCERIVMVGYTNAGKTSLMNALTSSSLSAKDMPFETLDATARCLTRRGGSVLLSDTVGFIRRLPDRLLASFASTLSEIHEASMIAVVVDVSDPERTLHLRTSEALLEKLGAAEIPRFYVFHKTDQLERPMPLPLQRMLSFGQPSFALSCKDPQAVQQLRRKLIETVRARKPQALYVPYAATEIMAKVYAQCHVLEAAPKANGMSFSVHAPVPVLGRLKKALRAMQK